MMITVSRYASRLYLSLKKRIAGLKLKKFRKPYKLHLGCGPVKFEGWINIDQNPSPGTVDIVWDLSIGIPVDEVSCEFIYCEHFLEHLTAEQGVSFLKECRRALTPGGVVRIAMPSLEEVADIYVNNSWQELDLIKTDSFKSVKTRAELMNMSFYWWGHRWLYDREELHRRLNESGFSVMHVREWGESVYPELQHLESRRESILICEATK